MFTGIIRTLTPLVGLSRIGGDARIAIDLGPLAETVAYSDSVSVSGVCLTVAAKSGSVCQFDIVGETLSRTTLGSLRPGDLVNIEPALRVGEPLGGHFVLGHIDGLGTIAAATPAGTGSVLKVSAEPALIAYMAPKGSVAVDGVSLTIADTASGWFTCALIPTTLRETTLAVKKPGDKVNIETDILAKLVAKLLGKGDASPGITLDTLRAAGFTT